MKTRTIKISSRTFDLIRKIAIYNELDESNVLHQEDGYEIQIGEELHNRVMALSFENESYDDCLFRILSLLSSQGRLN